MARPKKTEAEKPQQGGATLSIDVDSFVRTRDSVVTGLATLQDAIQTLSSAYIKHTNAVLGEYGAGLDVESSLSALAQNPLLGGLGGLRAPSPARSVQVVDVKKEKKKRVHDPNAPKRPLTPYFLYMQTARPIIAEDLGPDVAKGAVSTEGVRRWKDMADSDKQLWTNAYTDNLKLYNARMHAYKNGNISAKDMSDEEAAAYADIHSIGLHPLSPTAEGQLTAENLLDLPAADAASLPSSPAVSPPPPKVTPKAKAPARKAKGKATATPIVEPVAQAPIVPSSVTKPVESPQNKRKRKGKEDAVVQSIEKEEAAQETPKGGVKGGRKKKARNE